MINISIEYSNTVPKVLFTFIPVNKELEYKNYCLVQYTCKKFVVFGSNALKMSALFDKTFRKL